MGKSIRNEDNKEQVRVKTIIVCAINFNSSVPETKNEEIKELL